MKKEHFKQRLLLICIFILGSVLRFAYLDRIPISLYSDEVSQGYNAYSILITGKDEYGTLFPLSFRSFGDWKPPLQTYLILPFIPIFGLTPMSVRLPGAIFGSLTIVFIYSISMRLIEQLSSSTSSFLNIKKYQISLIASLILAISPWHILMSRSAMLVAIALFFVTLGIWSLLFSFKNTKYLYISAVSLVLSIYSYYGMRLIVPLLILIFFYWYFIRLRFEVVHTLWKPVLLGVVLLAPLVTAFIGEPNVLLGRAKTVSIFHDRGAALTVWNLIAHDGENYPSFVAQFLHNKPYHYVVDILRRFGQHLDGTFLFLKGDSHPPFQIPNMGVLHLVEVLFLVIGGSFIVKHEPKLLKLLSILIVISIFPAALTFVTPSANRTLTLLVPLSFISATGIVTLLHFANGLTRLVIKGSISVLLSLSLIYFLFNYVHVLPRAHASWWHGGYRELVAYLKASESSYDQLYISGKASVPYIFVLFYNKMDPSSVSQSIDRDLTDDEYGFEHVDAIGKYQFPRYFNWENDQDTLLPRSLLAVTDNEPQPSGSQVREIHQITYPDNTAAFRIYEIY